MLLFHVFTAIAVSSTVEGSTGPVAVIAPIERESVIRHTEKTNQHMSQCVIRDSATSSQCGRPNSRKRNPYKPRRRSPSKAKAISSCEPYIADSLM